MTLAWISLVILAVSHGTFLRRFVDQVRIGHLPAPVEFAGLSVVAYFDVGLFLQCLGVRFDQPYFEPVFDAPAWQICVAVGLIAIAPWLLRFGAGLVPQRSGKVQQTHELRQGPRRMAFYAITGAVCVACAALPFVLLTLAPRFWESRSALGELLGPWIIVLSLPMYLLAFYVRLQDSTAKAGRGMLALLVLASIAATVAVGQRTLVLLPLLIAFVFGGRVSWRRWALVAMVGTAGAALLLPFFKSSYKSSGEPALQLVADTVGNDFYRAPELVRAVGMSSWIGTETVGYPGSGYGYAALFFVPRGLAPFKGEGTAQQFTALVMQQAPESLQWGFGISAITEAVLNVGILLAPLVLLAYGVAIGWLTHQAVRWRAVEVPLTLACLWMFGYHLPALLLNFGAMAVVGMSCERIFTARSGHTFASVLAEPLEGPIL